MSSGLQLSSKLIGTNKWWSRLLTQGVQVHKGFFCGSGFFSPWVSLPVAIELLQSKLLETDRLCQKMLSGLWPIIVNIPAGVTGFVLLSRRCGTASLGLCFLLPRNVLEQSSPCLQPQTARLRTSKPYRSSYFWKSPAAWIWAESQVKPEKL